MSRVIACSLWYSCSTPWSNYLAGLVANVRLRHLFFPDWEIWLYVHESAWAVAPRLLKRLAHAHPQLKLLEVPHGVHPLLARYLPLWRGELEAVLVRDVDSLLSCADAGRVERWLAGGARWLLYREYLMTLPAMGGGLGLRGALSLPEAGAETLLGQAVDAEQLAMRSWRNADELLLQTVVDQEDAELSYTRMDHRGHYFFSSLDGGGPHQCLWACSIELARNAELEQLGVEELETALESLTVEECVASRQPRRWLR